MSEEWRPVVGFPDYMVSDLGRIYSHRSQIYLRPGIASHGYPTVALGRGNTRTVHSLVADAFLEECPPGHEVRHKDGNRKNPRKTNLCWGTRSDNVRDAIRHGTHVSFSKEAHKKAKETRLRNNPDTYRDAAKKGRQTEIKKYGANARTKIAKKTVDTKNELYGKSWGALGFAGVEYSKDKPL